MPVVSIHVMMYRHPDAAESMIHTQAVVDVGVWNLQTINHTTVVHALTELVLERNDTLQARRVSFDDYLVGEGHEKSKGVCEFQPFL